MRSIAFLLPGQGSQSPGMATLLYAHDEVFAAAMDEFFAAIGDDGRALRADWLSADPVLPMDHVQRSQPLLFAVDHAYGRLLRSWGVVPSVLLGHSMGEVAAAVLAGVLDFGEASRLVWWRCRQLVHAPPGGMLAVAAPPAAVRPHLRGQVVVGGVNAPKQTIVAGPADELREVRAALVAQRVLCADVPSQTPFHSPALAGFTPAAHRRFAEVTLRAPATGIISCYTARPLTAAEATDPGYWAPQPALPVLFWPALGTLLDGGDHVLVEAGPGQTLSRLARRHPALRPGRGAVLPMAPGTPHGDVASALAVREALAALTPLTQPSPSLPNGGSR